MGECILPGGGRDIAWTKVGSQELSIKSNGYTTAPFADMSGYDAVFIRVRGSFSVISNMNASNQECCISCPGITIADLGGAVVGPEYTSVDVNAAFTTTGRSIKKKYSGSTFLKYETAFMAGVEMYGAEEITTVKFGSYVKNTVAVGSFTHEVYGGKYVI